MKTPNFDEIITKAQKELHCPVCQRSFEVTELKVRGAIEDQVLIQASCQKDHNTALTLYVGSNRPLDTEEPMRANDVLDFHESLKKFNGDFKTVFRKLEERKK